MLLLAFLDFEQLYTAYPLLGYYRDQAYAVYSHQYRGDRCFESDLQDIVIILTQLFMSV